MCLMSAVKHAQLVVILASLWAGSVLAQSEAHCSHHTDVQSQPQSPSRYARSIHRYPLPEVTLTDQDGQSVPLSKAIPSDAAVAVNFIFTTCTTICPVMSATFSGLSSRLGAQAGDVRMVSISIDPEHDRPAALKAYARRFNAAPNWRFFTGSADDIRVLLTAFGAFAGDKANHRPLTLLRRAHGEDWVRIEGFPSAAELTGEYRELVAKQ
jgi:protein SCO1/2